MNYFKWGGKEITEDGRQDTVDRILQFIAQSVGLVYHEIN